MPCEVAKHACTVDMRLQLNVCHGQVRKKNLQPGSTHLVRIRAKSGETWGDFSDILSFTTLTPDAKLIEAPSVVSYPCQNGVWTQRLSSRSFSGSPSAARASSINALLIMTVSVGRQRSHHNILDARF